MDRELREMVFSLSHGYCDCCKQCPKQADQIHHLLSNTKVNKRLYPLFVNSIFNLKALNNDCHLNKPIPKITPRQADTYEKWLEKFKENL